MTYMLDTNICIYLMKKKPESVLRRFQKELNHGVCISSITLAELEFGMKHSSNPVRNEQALIRFLLPFSVLPFDAAAALEYGEIRAYLQSQGTPIGPLDMLIAGHARAEELILVTNNVREFERVPNLKIENWAEEAVS
jgi:tRNA(fMet)-specific endonuclease VapC